MQGKVEKKKKAEPRWAAAGLRMLESEKKIFVRLL